MEFLLLIAVCVVAYMLIDSNKTSSKNEASYTETTKIDKYGRIEVERTVSGSISNEQSQSYVNAKHPSFKHSTITSQPFENKIINSHSISNTNQSIIAHAQPNKEITHQIINRNRAISESIPMKQCKKCGIEKGIDEFYHSNKNDDGLSKWCKDCLEQLKKEKNTKESRYKVCSKCGKRREKWNFYPSKKQPDGLTKWCKPCHLKHG